MVSSYWGIFIQGLTGQKWRHLGGLFSHRIGLGRNDVMFVTADNMQ